MKDSSRSGRLAEIPILHGWRAVSILLVLAGHLLPMPPKALFLNHTAAAAGMALFFTLSGFLIVSFLAAGVSLSGFLLRRLARIVPLAWLAVLILLTWRDYDTQTIVRNFLFTANLPPATLLDGGHHLWSLGVEMQFYALAAALCFVFGRARGLMLVPILCVAVTLARVLAQEPISIVTWHRIDEVLVGGALALVYAGRFGSREWLTRIPTWVMIVAVLATSNPLSGPIQYLRPYAAALLVGSTLIAGSTRLKWALTIPPMLLLAEISYAVYVVHGVLIDTWLGSEPDKYLKRPLLLAATFLLAYVSTRFYEKPISRFVRRLESRWTSGRVSK